MVAPGVAGTLARPGRSRGGCMVAPGVAGTLARPGRSWCCGRALRETLGWSCPSSAFGLSLISNVITPSFSARLFITGLDFV